jgi:prolyl-tRNA editing enzyme YbaK/EbsC (Cys-tRNA(Pro) deacylase)
VKGPLDISQTLLAAGVPHELVRLPRRIASAHELGDALGVPDEQCLAVRAVEAGDAAWAVGSAPAVPLSLERLSAVLGAATIHVLGPDETSALTGYTAALVAPVALPDGLPLLVDAVVGEHPVVYTATGDPSTALALRTVDLLTHTGARVDAISVPRVVPLPGLHLGEPRVAATRPRRVVVG